MHIEILVAYILLTLALCSGVVLAYSLYDLEDYAQLPILLLVSLGVNVARRGLFGAESLAALLADRVLFFVWPFGVLALLCQAFGRRILFRCVLVAAALVTSFLLFAPTWITPASLRELGQGISATVGALSLTLVFLRGKRAAFLSPLEMAAFFCGIAEGIVALVGYLAPGKWWPAVTVYCVLYLALLLLHVHGLWTLRRTKPSHELPQT